MRKTPLFKFFDTEAEAKAFCEDIKKHISDYLKKNFPPHYTPWQSSDPRDTARFVVWYKV